MAAAPWVLRTLKERGVPFRERHHFEVFTAQEVAQQEHISGHLMAKVVVIMADGRPVALVLSACRKVVLDRIRRILGVEKVRLASEAEIATHFPDCELGAIPPLRHWPDVELILDASLWVEGDILFQAGTHRDVIQMRFDDWILMVQPRVEFFTEPQVVPEQVACSR